MQKITSYKNIRSLVKRTILNKVISSYMIYLLFSTSLLSSMFHFIMLPKLIQTIIKLCHFKILFMAISAPTEDSIHIKTQFAIKAWTPFRCTICFEDAVFFGFIKNRESNNNENEKIVFGKGNIDDICILPNQTSIIGKDLKLEITNEEMFSEFAKHSFMNKSNEVFIDGKITLRVFGIKVVRNIRFNKQTKVKGNFFKAGMSGLNNLKINNIVVKEGTKEHLKIAVESTVYNPSDMEIKMEMIKLNMIYNEEFMGTIVIPKLKLETGENTLAGCETFYMPCIKNPAALFNSRKLLSNYCNRLKTPLMITGDREDCAHPKYWHKAFKTMKIATIMPGNNESLIKSTVLKVTHAVPKLIVSLASCVNCSVIIKNPLEEKIIINSIAGKVFIKKKQVGEIQHRYTEKNNFNTIEAKEIKKLDRIEMKLSKTILKTLYDNNRVIGIYSDISSTLCVQIGSYSAIIDYNQSNIELTPEI